MYTQHTSVCSVHHLAHLKTLIVGAIFIFFLLSFFFTSSIPTGTSFPHFAPFISFLLSHFRFSLPIFFFFPFGTLNADVQSSLVIIPRVLV